MEENSSNSIQKQNKGSKVEVLYLKPLASSLNKIDIDKLKELINKCFKVIDKELVSDYFKSLDKKHPTIYLTSHDEEYYAGAISYQLVVQDINFEYLCKLFTAEELRGNGMAENILEEIIKEKESIVWRASKQNPYLKKYEEITKEQGGVFIEDKEYKIFIIGIDSCFHNKIVKAVSLIPKTLKELE